MMKINFCKEKVKVILAGTFLATVIFTGNVFATSTELKLNTSDAYENWEQLTDEEKQYTVMPRTYDVEIPDSVLSKYELDTNTIPRVLDQLLGKIENPLTNVGCSNHTSLNLADQMNIRVEHQQNTTQCWAFSLLKSVETNIALKGGLTDLEDFSERHMDYATSRTFLDGTNEAGFYRDTGKGGLLVVGLAYLVNGQGAVLESDMPFENNEEQIYLSEIDKPVDTIVNDYVTLPTIHKEYTLDEKGNTVSVKYTKANGTEYTESELAAVRTIIKEHIANNGAIASMTGGSYPEYYNHTTTFASTAYNCNTTTKIRDHAITIVGWDDSYAKENFGDGRMPSTDGAYIVLNSYGEDVFNNGYMYISYEDFFIEEELYGVASTGNVDYDNLYQYDYYGGIYQVGVDNQTNGGFAVTYERDSSKEETLNSVGITLADYANVEIYVNPNSSSFSNKELIKVGESTEVLSTGYHRIDITPTKLTGNSFVIMVKQTTETGRCYYQLEANVPNTAYALVDSENRSYISLDGNTWSNINNFSVDGIDMDKADVCIKAFTVEDEKVDDTPTEEPETPGTDTPEIPEEPEIPETPVEPEMPEVPETPGEQEPGSDEENELGISSTEYTIKKEYIMNIEFDTTKEELLNNITSNLEKDVVTSDGDEVLNEDVIKTGMKLKLSDGTEYILIVRGDINMDGRVSLTDLSKIILHYNEVKGFELTGDALKGADMNIDGTVNLVDVSQMVVLYGSI